jgi:hypothetical protein
MLQVHSSQFHVLGAQNSTFFARDSVGGCSRGDCDALEEKRQSLAPRMQTALANAVAFGRAAAMITLLRVFPSIELFFI